MSTDLPEVPKVLIVEDEMMLRMRAVDIVEDAGFSPVQAVNADQALSILESRSDISLLFTDIQMPGSMDGLKLAHAVHDRWPGIKIILVSGQVNPSDGGEAGRQPILRQAAERWPDDCRIAGDGWCWRTKDGSKRVPVARGRVQPQPGVSCV
jgi:CheY-like chemotaxis protein